MQSGFRHENNVTAVSHTIGNNMEGLCLYRYLKTPLSGFLRRYSMNEKCGSKQILAHLDLLRKVHDIKLRKEFLSQSRKR